MIERALKEQIFSNKEIDYSWSFADKTQKDTSYITHNYYTYPAKFIPQLAARLIEEYSNPLDIVVDPFMGSGTTMVESLVKNRLCVGVDINDIAYLVSKVKTTPLNLDILYKEYENIKNILSFSSSLFGVDKDELLGKAKKIIPNNEKIDYWFKEKQKHELSVILYLIFQINDKDIQNFFLVAFAQILKSCSIWLQKSVKPTRDKDKKEAQCFALFLNQVKKMIQKHRQYHSMLSEEVLKNPQKYINIFCNDSRLLPLQSEQASLIVTSPPYVTSYEYADLHQLPSLWFGFFDTLSEFRKKFIGSSSKERNNIDLKSDLAQNIVSNLKNKKAKEVKNYYADMLETFIEMKRVLKKGAKACIVIGNTQFKEVDILNAEVFVEQMQNIGFKICDIIHREIPSKMLPSTRDSKTGRFAKINTTNKLAYPTEYILIMEKI
ncbi:site-specific DNA-methyltransferase [Campylobacter upsaliensis]|uniref:site-specific DNA-methyltransferase n=1 Tax=Campylobacter upsaliensis TaxID=28080 RepID=UPI00214A4FC3|nr:site-specific DNA-methyltransferase [Campylobacter upsaliensis]MCR2110952.1 site-specific DNA-methyltransferase [Campylobacter upsaliensis]